MKPRKKGNYTSATDKYPEPGGPIGVRKPRRNYWGNLYEEDTYKEDEYKIDNYDYSDFDSEDDHDSYYSSSSYD